MKNIHNSSKNYHERKSVDFSLICELEDVCIVSGGSKRAKYNRNLHKEFENYNRFTATVNFSKVEWNKKLIYHFRWNYKSFLIFIANNHFEIEPLYRNGKWEDLDLELLIPCQGMLKITSNGKCKDAYSMTMSYVTEFLERNSQGEIYEENNYTHLPDDDNEFVFAGRE